MAGVAAIALVALPALLISAYLRARPGDYTRLPEYRAIIDDFLM